MDLVSVTIANWNGIRYIRRCLDDVFDQTYPKVEVIVVDNGSTDGSPRSSRSTIDSQSL